MKRTDITELFPEAEKEKIDKIMSINGADINAAKSELESLRQQLTDAMANRNTEELDKAQAQIADLTKELAGMKAAEALRVMRAKVAEEKKVPINLLTGDTEEMCAKQADDILAFSQQIGYPTLHDAGEIHDPPKASTRDKFADWARENL